ncbi:MAG: RloB family protein, partial [Actinomycetia bacterium]|nr:RloB family protein [Actinomycetes bacterium]
NPCFELWLLLHHGSQASYMITDDAVKKRQKLDEAPDKHLDDGRREFYMSRCDEAIGRAKELRDRHREAGNSSPDDNPSTDMDLLIERLRADRRVKDEKDSDSSYGED